MRIGRWHTRAACHELTAFDQQRNSKWILLSGAEDPQGGRTGSFQDGIQDEAGGEAITSTANTATTAARMMQHSI